MNTITKKKATKKDNAKTGSYEAFELKINLPDEKITDEEIMEEVKKVRYAGEKHQG